MNPQWTQLSTATTGRVSEQLTGGGAPGRCPRLLGRRRNGRRTCLSVQRPGLLQPVLTTAQTPGCPSSSSCYPTSAPHLPRDDHDARMMFQPGPGVRSGFLILPVTRSSSQHFLLAGVRSQIPFQSLRFSEYSSPVPPSPPPPWVCPRPRLLSLTRLHL